jgi:ATP-dependent DNA helicase RecQ
MEAEERRRSQERWMSDEARVMVGTIAFGLGINKSAVRAVIHLSLPKSIEQYYQEAGRAGRDGLPAECVLLWQKRDAGLHAHFIGQITDPSEKQRAWDRYHEIRNFVESKVCRHLQICRHFGETPKWRTCEACDFCGYEPAWLSVREETPSRPALLQQKAPPRKHAGTSQGRSFSDVDPALREYLRDWRRNTAKRQSVPAFVVMHDTTLDEICRTHPRSHADLLRVSGIGERKAELYGSQILAALKEFKKGSRTAKSSAK